MKKYNVGIIGATGMVGQRFALLLHNHPWFNVSALAASSNSADKKYTDAIGSRWAMKEPIPENLRDMTVFDAERDIDKITERVDFVFCAVNMKKDEIKSLEEKYAKHECPVVSNNSAHRFTPDVPMIIPEINAGHLEIIPAQRKRLDTKRGFIAVKSNCSLQSYVPALYPLDEKFGVERVLVSTYQAISGAGKTFERWPEMIDNVIPFIGGEEEKSEKEPLKIWGKIENGEIVPAESPKFTAQCIRVPVSDGHLASVFVDFKKKPTKEEYGQTIRASRKRSPCRTRPSNFYIITPRTICRKPDFAEILRAVWQYPSGACARIRSMITSLSAYRTIPCAALRAARCF